MENQAKILEAGGGWFQLLLRIHTKAAQPKRQRLLSIMAIREVMAVEKLVSSMSYEDVEQNLVRLEPVKGTNGEGAKKDDEKEAATAPA